MTIDEAINGRPDGFPGLMGVVNAYLNSLNVDVSTKCDLRRYLDLIKHRAQGECGATEFPRTMMREEERLSLTRCVRGS
jgi:glutamate--cysteine ligase catalytic subunit